MIAALVLATAWVLVIVLRRRSVRSDLRRRAHTIAALVQESAAFAARWTGQRFAQAPVGELAAEHARNGRLLALLDRHHASATDPAERQQAIEQIAAVQRWWMVLPPCPPDVTSQPPVPGSTGPRRAPSRPVASTSALNGFPLGELVVLFGGQPDRVRDVSLLV